jgi:hypothetical protein
MSDRIASQGRCAPSVPINSLQGLKKQENQKHNMPPSIHANRLEMAPLYPFENQKLVLFLDGVKALILVLALLG